MAARGRKEQVRAVIGALNALGVGELSSIETRLAVVREELVPLSEPDIQAAVDEARTSLLKGDLGNFRRLVSQAVSRLGHLK